MGWNFGLECGIVSEEIGAIFGNTGFEKGLMNDGEDDFEVGASGDFGDNTAVSGKDVNLGDDNIAEEVEVGWGNFVNDIIGCVDGLG